MFTWRPFLKAASTVSSFPWMRGFSTGIMVRWMSLYRPTMSSKLPIWALKDSARSYTCAG